MELGQLALNRYVLEQIKEGKKPSISNDQKVDLDYLANFWNNIITWSEREFKKKPRTKRLDFRLVIERGRYE